MISNEISNTATLMGFPFKRKGRMACGFHGSFFLFFFIMVTIMAMRKCKTGDMIDRKRSRNWRRQYTVLASSLERLPMGRASVPTAAADSTR